MRASSVLVLAGLAVVAVTQAHAVTSSGTSLRVTYWKNGADAKETSTWTLRCPPGGTLPRPAAACRRLARGGPMLFAPLPKNIVCTEIYGGPHRARIVGTVAGKRIWATFTRRNGCHISRWNRLAPWLLPPGGIT
ncbi:MAG TPA: SSI family serine proteinase inhibitor [Gaiellaceae bacterium]|nr:SSI family serine proteinase inhibitor [Gaiellaceae bacterium]